MAGKTIEAVTKTDKTGEDQYIDPQGYWIDPGRNLRRMGTKDGEQVVIMKATEFCPDAEWDRFYGAIVACVNLAK